MNLNILSPTQQKVADYAVRGYQNKEIAYELGTTEEAVKTHKKVIHKKFGINNNTELLLYMICIKKGIEFNINSIRKHGIEILFCYLFSIIQITGNVRDIPRVRTYTARTHCRTGTRSLRRSREYEIQLS